jgi:hypothetical protein
MALRGEREGTAEDRCCPGASNRASSPDRTRGLARSPPAGCAGRRSRLESRAHLQRKQPDAAMPSYDYHCPANGRVVEIAHKMAESVSTWGEVCRRAGIPIGSTAPDERVERLITGGNVVHAGALGSQRERPCDSGPCGAPACGRGTCGL